MNEGDLERVYQDIDLVCCDGVSISYPKLVAGLVFPSLATCHVLQFPTQHTLLLPDYTSADVTNIVHAVLGLSLDALFSYNCEQEAVKDDDTKDLSEYLEVETKEDSDDETSGDEPLICKICFAQFKTKSGWKNHKVIHQKFRTKEFACYICFRRFYWDKDCRRHVKNIHGIDNYDSEESRSAANINLSSLVNSDKSGNLSITPNDVSETNPISSDLKNNFLKMKIQMVKCKKNQLNNAINNKKVVMKPNCDNNQVNEVNSGKNSQEESNNSISSCNMTLNNNVKTDLSAEETGGEKSSQLNGLVSTVDCQSTALMIDLDSKNQEYSSKSKVPPKKFQCQECSKKFLNSKSLKSHSRGCNAPKDSPYSCTLCDRRFLDFEKLQKHWKVNHSRQKML